MTEMWARVKKSKNRPRLSSGILKQNRGQALIEYVLILVITVSIVLGLMNVIFKPFGEFISRYMGQYTACLLEYGELPTLGSEVPSEVDEGGECNKRFEGGTLAGGRPPREGGGNAAQKTTPNNKDGGSSGGGGRSRSAGGGSTQISRMGQRPNGMESPGNKPVGKSIDIAVNTGSSGSFFAANNREYVLSRPEKTTYVAITGLSVEDKKKLEQKKKEQNRTVATGDSYALPVKKMAVKKPPEKPAFAAEEDPWTIGNFIRFIFIAAIVIVLVIFIGGQALQMSKNFEK